VLAEPLRDGREHDRETLTLYGGGWLRARPYWIAWEINNRKLDASNLS
jgi:hypothetical protein